MVRSASGSAGASEVGGAVAIGALATFFQDHGHAQVGALAQWRVGEGSVAGHPVAWIVVAHHVLEGDDLGRRAHRGGVDVLESGDRLEDVVELADHALDLVLGQAEAGEGGDVLYIGAADHEPMLAGTAAEPAVKESASMSQPAAVARSTSIPIEGGRIEAFQMPGGPGVPLLVLGGVELGFRPLAGTESVLQRRWAGRARRRQVTVLGRPIPDDPADAPLLMHPRVIADGASRALTALNLAPPVGPVAIEAESGGGRISLWLTVEHPELVARLVLSSVASETPADSPMATRMARWIELAEAQDWGRLFTGFAAQMQPAGNTGDDGEDAFAAAARLQPRPATPERFIGELKATLDPSSFVTARLGEIHIPTLVLAGGKDQVVPPGRTRQVADAIPGARFDLDTDSGHTVRQSFRGYDELVEAFLAEGDPH